MLCLHGFGQNLVPNWSFRLRVNGLVGPTQFAICDLSGRIITDHIVSNGVSNLNIDVEKGVYVALLKDKTKTLTKKLVVQ